MVGLRTPQFGHLEISKINNAAVRAWVTQMIDAGLSPATARARQCSHCEVSLNAAIDDNRIRHNPALSVPLPAERQTTPRFLPQKEVERLVDGPAAQYKALVLLGAYADLRWGEAVGLTRSAIDVMRSRVIVSSTAVEVKGTVTLGDRPRRSAPDEAFRWRAR